jgi:HSP20 family protein
MTLIRRTNPLGELISLRQAMDRLFEDSYVRARGGNALDEHALALDIYTTPDSLVVEAALPGVKPDDVDISVLGDTLTISATTHQEQSREDDGYSYREIRRGSFSRTVTLPGGLKPEAATASFDNGLLRLSIPKAEETKPRQIQIKPTTEGQSTTPSTEEASTDRPADQTDETDQPTDQPAQQPTDQPAEQPRMDAGRDWHSTSDLQSGDQWQSSAPWQSDGQEQYNEQPRVEQGS